MSLVELKSKLDIAKSTEGYNECVSVCRELLEEAIEYLYAGKGLSIPPKATLLELIDGQIVSSYINDIELLKSLHYVRILSVNSNHGREVRKKEAKLSLDNMIYFIGFIEAKENGSENAYKKPPYMSEAATRRLYIDLYLQEAGWSVMSTENVPSPGKAAIEIEVEGMPNDKAAGFCDYVLYGRDGKPLAVVEVKKTSVSPEVGRHQVDLYGECLKKKYGYKPVLYYTNGYTTKVIDGLYPDRSVVAFHTIDELELMLQRRNRGDITDLTINDSITNRPYQKMAITKVCEYFNENHRRGLIVMATGTGKTRVAISLVDILARNSWIKNVLFLADRTSLVSQAKRNFSKLMPSMSVCELSGSGEKDLNARLMFCTYQTMINYIDAEDKKFSSGRFDLIIIDEAHRSIFNRYGSIFKYFDSLLVGLTATPKDEVDANTYQIFDCESGVPNFDYSLEDAIKEHYLVGYKAINRTSKLLSQGAKYEDLSDDEKAQLDDYLIDEVPSPDFDISGNAFFKVLFNEDTIDKVLDDLMRWGLRVHGGETLGKTIIFAFNHKHAQMIVDRFRALYPKMDPNTCQLVDYSVKYSEDLVVKFEEDDTFRIAVSVDMLDTGVDVPAVQNLVFFKRVHSKIKYVQMIGRGTRLCEDLLGPGIDKDMFLIFDYCGNFEYFGTHPDGKEGKQATTLTQRRFNVLLDMLFALQRLEYQEQDWYRDYYNEIKKELHSELIKIKNNSSRIQVRESMQYVDKYYDLDTWKALSPVNVKEAKVHIGPLIDGGVAGDYLSVAFDIRVYNIERSLVTIETINNAIDDVKNIRLIAQYMMINKASIPQVLAKAKDLKRLVDNSLWEHPSVPELEELRVSVRELMQFLKGEKNPTYDVNIKDEITNSDYIPGDTVIDIRTYREKVIDYLVNHSDSSVVKKIYNLEPITSEDIQELEHVLWTELGTHEDYNKTTDISNLAAFVRSLIGLNQEAVNEKFGEYLSGNVFNSQQQEFIWTIINYVRENGDIEVADIANVEPFNNFDIVEMFGEMIPKMVDIVNVLHNSIYVA